MKRLTTTSRIMELTDSECLSRLSNVDREVAHNLGNSPRSVLLQRAKESSASDPARGTWTRAEFAELSKSLGNDPLTTSAVFEARGGTYVDEPDEGSDEGEDDEPLAAVDSNEEPLVCSDDGAKRRALGRIKMGSQLHHGQAQPFVRDPPVVVGRPRRT